MTARCDFSELPVESCAHCTGRTGQPDMADVEIANRFTARYSGRCPLCDLPFREGDTIARTTDGEYVCGRCAA